MTRSPRRWLIASGLPALIALMLVASPAAAAHVISDTGTHGTWYVTDNSTTGGAMCFYYNGHNGDPDNTDMYRIRIFAPQMRALNRTDGRDAQMVGWRFVIQHGTSAGSAPVGWKTQYTSPFVKALAHDDTPAAFLPKRDWPGPKPFNRWWRVQIVMQWYKPGSSTIVAGQVKIRLEWYSLVYPPGYTTTNPALFPGACLPEE
jgi:hypothetical protein